MKSDAPKTPLDPEGRGHSRLPLGVVIGEDEYSMRIETLLRQGLSHACEVVRFATSEDAVAELGPTPVGAGSGKGHTLGFVTIVVGEGTRNADDAVQPLMALPEFAVTRVLLLSTTLELDGVRWLAGQGRLDWVGYAPEIQPEAFLESVEAQLMRFHEHQKADSAFHVSSVFDLPLSDTEIIYRVLEQIEGSLGSQPRIRLPEGVRLTSKGEWVEEVTIILSGSVALLHESSRGDIVMHEESTGRIIGLLAVSEGRRAFLNAVTTSEVVGVRLTLEQLNSAIEGHPDIAMLLATLFIRSLDRRLRRAEQLHIENVELSEQLDTERGQLATALTNLEDARTELSAQERLASLGALSAGIAHELNNPIAAIQRIGDYLGEDVAHLLQSAPDAKWSDFALAALRGGLESTSLSSRAERQLRRELTQITGDAAIAQRLALAGIRDPELAKQLTKRSAISLDSAEQAASIGTQLRNLRSAASRITDLVSSLRSYARPDGDIVEGVDIHQNLDDAIRLLSHKLTNIEVVREYSDTPALDCHPGQLAQVWTNLLTNAAEAIVEDAESNGSAQGLKRLTSAHTPLGVIVVRTRKLGERWVRVEIADDGPGISEDILDRVFEPRFTTKSGQVRFGLGVGLGVSRTIVGKHHGTMRIHSSTAGTTVVVDLPTKAPKEEE